MPRIILTRLFITLCSVLISVFFYRTDSSLAPMLLALVGFALSTDISRYWGKRVVWEKEQGNPAPFAKTGEIIKEFFDFKKMAPPTSSSKGRPLGIVKYFIVPGVVAFAIFIGLTPEHERDVFWQNISIMMLGGYYDKTGQPDKALALLQKYAEESHAGAQFGLALMHHNGLAGPKNYELSTKWFSKAAANGHTKAKVALGDIYMDGDGVEADCKKASNLFAEAMASGSELAQLKLARIHMKGLCGERNSKAAYDLLIPLAEKDNPFAQYVIGLMYKSGDGVEKSIDTADAWFQRAANNGSIAAAKQLK